MYQTAALGWSRCVVNSSIRCSYLLPWCLLHRWVLALCRYIGLQQGDPDMTFDRLPTGEAMQELEPGVKLLDLRTTSYQQLMDLSAASAPNPFGELLPFNPGVLPARLGYMTGVFPCLAATSTRVPQQNCGQRDL